MTVLRAHFDGKVLVPDEPVDLPIGQPLELRVSQLAEEASAPPAPLAELAELASRFRGNPAAPRDGAAQHDHYLYGLPKKP